MSYLWSVGKCPCQVSVKRWDKKEDGDDWAVELAITASNASFRDIDLYSSLSSLKLYLFLLHQ